ncbi:hypothetical protein GCM10007161_05250 [Ignatzschineria indica]|uniref:Uncharacterized protein n=1 Tax=Ignatzschineria indica TaxID=472583 RepID=A0A2U2AMS3_9GAMM|nr:hypothetical protein [Ignatzschineria indica]PWD84514.1 hypothetical protein DC082_02960 [Ignatzschineria indica]GGZ77052.1 hypothetical protein GCM10007161_05250 [Ignatzschineria indica]
MQINYLVRYEIFDSMRANNLKLYGHKIGIDPDKEPDMIPCFLLHLYLKNVYSGEEYEPRVFELHTDYKGQDMKDFLNKYLDPVKKEKIPIYVEYDVDRNELVIHINVKPYPEFADKHLRIPAARIS